MKDFRFLLLFLFILLSTPLWVHAQSDVLPLEKDKSKLTDSLLKTIDVLHDKANDIENLSEKGFNLQEVRSGLPQISRDIRSIKSNLASNIQVMDMKSLQTFETLLQNAHDQLDRWRNLLLGYNRQLVNMQTEIEQLHENPLLKSFQSDSLFVRLYTTELLSIERSWNKAQRLTAKNLREISMLQANVTTQFYETGDLQKELKVQIRNYSARITGKEYPFIWKSYHSNMDQQALAFLQSSLLTQKKLILEYLTENIVYHLFLASAIFGLFVYWIRMNRQKLLAENKKEDWYQFRKGGLLSAFPVLPALIVVFNLAPFFDLNPPQAYIALLQFILFIIVTVFISRHWPKQDRWFWIKIGISFILFIPLNGVFNPGTAVRVAILLLNGFLAYHALYFIRNKCTELQLTKFARQVSYVFLILNVLAILLNITGRVTLARVFTNAAIVGFVQIVALSIFLNIVKTAFMLQVHTASVVNNGSSLINYDKLNRSLSRFLSIIVVCLWVIVFLSNMNLYNALVEGTGAFLFKPRLIGSTSFTIGNILLFILVIYLSSLAQKYVGYIFGENQGHTAPGERKGSKVVMTKLIIILIGFLLAVLVSGLPVDKITVVLGAFGVGIGLGLQTIVNNFVSGVILIFERPLQVGDYVEVSGYKGWVNDIGIRATRLSSSEGAEILVPNGTILSGNLVNWTLSNSQIRLEMNFKFSPSDRIKEAKKIIEEVLLAEGEVVKTRHPEIFNQSVNGEVAEIKVWFWIGQVARQQMVRSILVSKIYDAFGKSDIKLQ